MVYLQDIIIPFVVAIFLVYLLRPIVNRFSGANAGTVKTGDEEVEGLISGIPEESPQIRSSFAARFSLSKLFKVQLPRWAGVTLATMLAIAMVAGVIMMIIQSLRGLEGRMPLYKTQAEKIWKRFIVFMKTTLAFDVSGTQWENMPGNIFGSIAESLFKNSASILGDAFVTLVFLVYLLLENTSSYRPGDLRAKIDDGITTYLGIKTMVSFLVAVLVYLILILLQVPLALCICLVTFIMNWIPNLGPVVATLLPLPILILDPSLSNVQAVLAVVLPGIVHFVVGNILEPIVFDRQLFLHPVVILLSLGMWYTLWGAVGAMLAVPLTAMLRIYCDHLCQNGVGMPYSYDTSMLLQGRVFEYNPRAENEADVESASPTKFE